MKIQLPTNYLVWDLETTGFSPEKDRIIEVGFLTVRDGEVDETQSILLNHDVDISAEATAVHGITKEKCAVEGVASADGLMRLLALFEELPMNITHNGYKFDVPFLLAEIARCGAGNEWVRKILENRHFDTAVIYKAKKLNMEREWNEPFVEFAKRVMGVYAKGVKFNLGLACDEMDIDRSDIVQHRAGGDVELTNALYKKLFL